MPRETGRKLIAQNKKARHDYSILDTYEVGLVLTGTEVKSLRAGRASLVDGFATVDDGEVWLQHVHIPEYTQGTWTNHAPRRKRKVLMHRAEIEKLIGKTKEGGLTLVPLDLYFKDGKVKATLALARARSPTTSGTTSPSAIRAGRSRGPLAGTSRAAVEGRRVRPLRRRVGPDGPRRPPRAAGGPGRRVGACLRRRGQPGGHRDPQRSADQRLSAPLPDHSGLGPVRGRGAGRPRGRRLRRGR